MKDVFRLTELNLNTTIGGYDIIPLVYEYRHDRFDAGAHMHGFMEIQYNMRGNTLYRMNGQQERILRDDEVLLIGAGVLHEERVMPAPVRESVCFSFAFKPRKGKSQDPDVTALLLGVPPGSWSVRPLTPEISATLDRIADEYHGHRSGCMHLLKGMVSELIFRTLRTLGAEDTPRLLVKNLSDQSEFLLNDYFYQIHCGAIEGSMGDVASMLCVSPRQVNRILNRIYHRSFTEMVLENKIMGAAEKLLTTTLSVSDIASIYGFCSSSAFGAAFKIRMGVTPGQYRKGAPDTSSRLKPPSSTFK